MPLSVSGTRLDGWEERQAQGLLPELVRRLILATTPGLGRLDMRAGDGIRVPGFDGVVQASTATPWVPLGDSVWELGTGSDPVAKAEADLAKRRVEPDRTRRSFVFVTHRRWAHTGADVKHRWADEQTRTAGWLRVVVLDADDLETWLTAAPTVRAWLASTLGSSPSDLLSLDDIWTRWAGGCTPSFPHGLLLADQDTAVERVRRWLRGGDRTLTLRADTLELGEAFVAAVVLGPADEPDRTRWLAQTGAVRSPEAWDEVMGLAPLHLIVGELASARAAEAEGHGHSILRILTPGETAPAGTIGFALPARATLRSCLEASGWSPPEIVRQLEASGRSPAALRDGLLRVPPPRPGWATGPHAGLAARLLLARHWDASNASDLAQVARLAEVADPVDLPSRVSDLIGCVASPLRRRGDEVLIASPGHAWRQVGSRLSAPDLDRFVAVATEELGRLDPALERPLADRWMARAMAPIARTEPAPPVPCSGLFRRGLARSLAVLGTGAGLPSEIAELAHHRGVASRVVREVVTERARDWRVWATLGALLPVLAEASPERFLEAVETLLWDSEGVRPLFDTESPLAGFPYVLSLVRSLQTLAHVPAYLTRSASALARLAAVDPGGNYHPTPSDAMAQLLDPAWNQIQAPPGAREAVLDRLAIQDPDLTWKLVHGYVSKDRGFLVPIGHPEYLEVPGHEDPDPLRPNRPGTPDPRYLDHLLQVMTSLATRHPPRWAALLSAVDHFDEAIQDAILQGIADFLPGPLAPEDSDRVEAWTSLRRLLSNHRAHPGARWALPEATLARVQEIYDRATPDDLALRFGWLFAHRPDLPSGRLPFAATTPDALRAAWSAAIEAVFTNADPHAVLLRLIQAAPQPGFVSVPLAARFLASGSDPAEEERVLLCLLGSASEAATWVGSLVVAELHRNRQAPWIRDLVRTLEADAARRDQVHLALRCLPFAPETWDLVDATGAEQAHAYWQQVRPLLVDSKEWAPVERACHRLLAASRPYAALWLAYLALPGEAALASHEWPLAVSILEGIYETTIHGNSSEERTSTTSYELAALLRRLSNTPDADRARVAPLEWSYLPLQPSLDGWQPRVLQSILLDGPDEFGPMLATMYFAADDEERAPVPEHEKAKGRNFRILLDSGIPLPGTQPDGRIDAAQLIAWVRKARESAHDHRRQVTGDLHLGNLLSRAPTDGEDGLWGRLAIRDLLEDLANTDLERGLTCAIRNSRGISSRGALDGGDQERELASTWEARARKLEARWPRTAGVCRGLASYYRADAGGMDTSDDRRRDL